MGVTVVIGAQWGDEGKGKIVDLLAERADVVARFQGGPNAGHTVSVGGRRTSMHHIPSGILHPGRPCILGNGMVIDPTRLMTEIETLEAAGVEVRGRLKVSDRAHLIFPHQQALDAALEEEGTLKIGTTKRGVGYAYQAKVGRVGIRPADLDDPATLVPRLDLGLRLYEAWRPALPSLPVFTREELLAAAERYRRQLEPFLADTVEVLHEHLTAGKKILCEGSQGTLLDVDHGTYPFVTSSNTTVGAVCAGAGIPPRAIQGVIGVFKAYATRVGRGPMPTELLDVTGETLRQRGREFGTTTGRPRRCGWFDGVAARYAARLNGLTAGALMLLDVLDTFDEVRLASGYEIDGRRTTAFPAAVAALSSARPLYETLAGWRAQSGAARRYADLAPGARAYIERLEALVGVGFPMVSVGPDRDQTILRDGVSLDALLG